MRSPKITLRCLVFGFLRLAVVHLGAQVLGQEKNLGEGSPPCDHLWSTGRHICRSCRSDSAQFAEYRPTVSEARSERTGIGLVAFDVLLVKQAVQHAGDQPFRCQPCTRNMDF